MPNTFTQIHIHFVFAVKYRAAVIQEEWESRLHRYITGIVQNNGHKLIAINSVPDHTHVFVGLSPKQSISDLMCFVKGDSSEFVNNNKFTKSRFRWQDGYGAFSVSHRHIDQIVKYIYNQKIHHKNLTFLDEYKSLLIHNNILFDEKYIFKDLIN